MDNRKGHLVFESWAGRTSYPVTIIKETPKRFLVRLDADCPFRAKGKTIYVPKYAVKETTK